jgi:hypothetical protein
MAATIRRSPQNSDVYLAYGIVSSDRPSLITASEQLDNPQSKPMRFAFFGLHYSNAHSSVFSFQI